MFNIYFFHDRNGDNEYNIIKNAWFISVFQISPQGHAKPNMYKNHCGQNFKKECVHMAKFIENDHSKFKEKGRKSF